MCFAGGHQNDRTSTIPIVCQAGDDHSLAPRWVSSVLALAIAQPCWQTEGLG
jgi:hypothetical protein